MGGFDLQSLEIEQGIEALGIIVSTYESTLPTSNLFRQSLEFAQLEVGLDKSLFLSNFKSYGDLIMDGWIKAVWRFYHFYHLELHLPRIHHPQSQVLNDKTIMKTAVTSKLFNNKALHKLNIMQMHLEVIFISDLVEPGTNTIRTNIQQVERDEFIASKYEWPSISPTNNARTI